MRRCLFVMAAVSFLSISIAASAQTTFVYTANTLGSSISIYKLNTTTGTLTATGGSPFQADSPAYLAPAAAGKFLVVSGGSCPFCGLQTFGINPTIGALTLSHSYEQIGSVDFLVGQIAQDTAGTTIYTQGTLS